MKTFAAVCVVLAGCGLARAEAPKGKAKEKPLKAEQVQKVLDDYQASRDPEDPYVDPLKPLLGRTCVVSGYIKGVNSGGDVAGRWRILVALDDKPRGRLIMCLTDDTGLARALKRGGRFTFRGKLTRYGLVDLHWGLKDVTATEK